ncbi:MAG: InlB B-repeat-containing protein [Ruminococcus sp.]
MRKLIAENLIKSLDIAVALLIATVMMFCANISASAKDLGANLVIDDTDTLLSDINVSSISDTKMKQLIASGANVELISTAGSVTSDGSAVLFFNMNAVSWWNTSSANGGNFAYFFNSGGGTWSGIAKQCSGDYYYVVIPSGTWTGVILTRNNTTTSPSWDNKWNQTDNITIEDGKNYISSFSENSTTATWGTYTPTPTTYSITADNTSIKAGETVTFTPSINYSTYNVIKSNEFSVSGGSSSDYTIDNENKKITFKTAGTYTVTDKITYNAKGYSSITGNVTTSGVTITVTAANPDVAESVSLTAGDGRFNGKTFDLTATLNSKHDTGEVTYTFSKESGGAGEFSTTTVTTADSSATVSFTPSSTGDYTFKVVVSEENHNDIETTLTVSVKSSSWYVFGQWTGSWDTGETNLKANPMEYDEENRYFYFTKEAVIYDYADSEDKNSGNLYFRLYNGSSQKGGSDTSNDTVITTGKTDTQLSTNTSKALKVTGLTATEIVTVYTDGVYVWYSKTEAVDYNVTVDSDSITHGTVTADKATAKPGETVTLTVSQEDGYELSTLKYNTTDNTVDIDRSKKQFTMPSGDVTITATFTPITYTIKYYIGGEEDTSFEPKSYTVESDDITLPKPEERTGYTFKGWYLDSDSDSGDPVTTIPKGSFGHKQFYGNYVANKYTVTFDAGEGGTVTPGTNEVTYNSTFGELPIPTKDGCTFQGWYYGETKIESSTTVTITSNITLVAKYVDNPTITVTIMYNDAKDTTKAAVKGDGQLTYGGDSTVTITPADGYYISALTGDVGTYEVSNGAWEKAYTNITSDINIVATISDNPSVTVKVFYDDNEVTNMATVTGDGKATGYGVSKTVLVTPNEEYYIHHVKENDALINTYTAKAGAYAYTFSGKQDTVLSVYLYDNPKVKVKYFDVRSGAEITSGDVSVTIAGKQNTSDGVSVTYNSTPELNAIINTPNSYKFVGYFSADGTTQLSVNNPYTLSNNVTSDTEVVAKFDKLYKITVNWENLDGLVVDGSTLTSEELAEGKYYLYRPQAYQISLTTTIKETSEYKLNAGCFTASNLTGASYNQEYSSNVTTKQFNCTVGSTTGEITITPVSATYSGSGYWGEKVLKIDVSAVIGDSPYFTVKFSKSDASGIEARMVCTDADNYIYECPIPTGYDSITLYRRKPSDGTVWNTASTTLSGNTEFKASFSSGMVLTPKS